MKNIKNFLIVLFTFIIVILIIFMVKNLKNNNSKSQNNKIISEIDFLDNKLTALINGVNGITLENIKIAVTKTSTNSSTQSKSQEEQNVSKNLNNNDIEQYELKNEGILTNDVSIDWNIIKNEVEVLYSIVPTITLDLYSKSINQDEILNFNKELDDLTVVVKDEDQEKSLIKLVNLYRYLPAYANKFSENLSYVSLLEVKSNIFNAYALIKINNWEEASNYINKAIESYSRTINNISDKDNSFDINKTYIILNELQSAVNIRDKDVFLIKYKNFIEETEKQKKY